MVSSFLCFNFPDILVTKAGPGTIAEASICGLPCILSSFLPGQEEGNVPYVVDNGFGCYRGSPEGIADTVEEWFASTRAKGSMLERMRDSALVAVRPDATLDIAKDLAYMLYTPREELRKGGGNGGGGVGGVGGKGGGGGGGSTSEIIVIWTGPLGIAT